MARQAGTCVSTHHTSRHPDGTLVPLMKEVETVSVADTCQSVPCAHHTPGLGTRLASFVGQLG